MPRTTFVIRMPCEVCSRPSDPAYQLGRSLGVIWRGLRGESRDRPLELCSPACIVAICRAVCEVVRTFERCPGCGAFPILEGSRGWLFYACRPCGLLGRTGRTAEKARAGWNERAQAKTPERKESA